MKIISNPKEIKKELKFLKLRSVGFVPTMGALHKGHISLIEKALEENEIVVVSIYVNPTQFENKEDLTNYPSVFENDSTILEELNVDYLFTPTYVNLYPDDFTYRVDETLFSKELCGKTRDGHFIGVLTVVMKLLNIVNPTKVYFGEKDKQQLLLVKGMISAFFLDTEIVSLPTVRESDGLAMSSRNSRLNEEERNIASQFPALLKSNKTDGEICKELNMNGFRTDYIQTIDGIRFGAAYLGKIRLIDNVKI